MQLVPWAAQEQEGTPLLEKICNNFKKVCQMMDVVRKDMSQHVEDICRMKIEVLQMRGKATLESHEAMALWDMISKLINIVHELKDYTETD